MSNRQLVKLAFCICLLPLFFSCSSERDEGSEGSGTLHVQVNANPEVVVGTNTRVGDGTEQGVPDVNDFSFSIFKGETLRGKWATLADFRSDDELTLRPGNYTAVASYSDVENEGFELPYFEGNQSFTISKGKTTNVKVTCYLANAKLKIAYTDAFKEFFSSYSSEVTSSLNNIVKYEKLEERYGYFKPGELQVRTTFRKKQGSSQEVTVQAKTFFAEARHAYILTLDVDAGSSMVNISFSDDIPNQEPITIDVSDEALSAPAPYLKANGFGTEALSVVEGKSAESSQIYAYLNAAGGIAHCNLTTHSNTLIEQGWPESVDLANVPAEILEKMQGLGLKIVGLSDKKDKIAMIDFTNVIPFLEYKEGDAEHLFTLNAVDILSKTNEEPLTLKVNSLDNKFAITTGPTIAYGTTKVNVNMTLDGDPLKVNYWLKVGDSKQAITPKKINSDKEQHQLTFVLPESQTSVMQIEANYLRRMKSVESTVESPLYTLSLAYPGDVWNNKATLQVDKVVETGWDFQYSKKGNWSAADYSLSGTEIYLKSLPSNEKLICRFVNRDKEGDIFGTSNLLTIHTEKEMQLPNANMEEWSYETGTNDWWRKWFPWNSESSKGWNTINEKTTADGGGGIASAYAYIANSGTIQTADCYEGDYAALIRTIGWGKGTTAPGPFWDGSMKRVDPGYLYLGEYSESPESTYIPYAFVSRPAALSFYYKYTPASGKQQSNDNFEIRVIVEHREGDNKIVLADEYLKEGGIVAEYTPKKIQLNYVDVHHQATHLYILFKSGTVTEYKYFKVPSRMNLSDGEYIGSQLYIDNIKLEYN